MQLLNICPPSEGVGVVRGLQSNQSPPEPTVLSEEGQKREHRRIVYRAWVAKNKAHRLEYIRRYNAANKQRLYEVHRKWRLENMDYRRVIKREWSRSHKESTKRTNRKNYLNNHESRKAYQRAHAIKNRERIRTYQKKYHQRHYPKVREKILAYSKAYSKANPGYRKAVYHRRRARLLGADVGDKHVCTIIEKWKSESSFICHYCQNRFPRRRLHIDHIIALSRGGKHCVGNLCKSCGSCNCSKNANPITEMVRNGQPLLL